MEQTSLTVSVTAAKTSAPNVFDVLINVAPPDSTKRAPADICCVVDVSGSMSDRATIKNEQGVEESHGLTLLDITKHAVKTIVAAMQPTDRLSIVTFSSNAEVIFKLTEMTSTNQKIFNDKIETLHTMGSTNLWSGLHMGMELLNLQSTPGRTSGLVLLTDGQTDGTLEGELKDLKKYKDGLPFLSGTINTFGFGYNINSTLLSNLAEEGDGMYMFIPDSSFVGTGFVNYISNNLVTFGSDVTVSLEPQNGATIDHVYGLPSIKNDWGHLVRVSSLQYGQSKDVVVRMTIPQGLAANGEYLQATVKYRPLLSKELENVAAAGTKREDSNPAVDAQRLRLEFVETVKKSIAIGQEKGKPMIVTLAETISKGNASGDDKVQALLADVEGQVTEAFSTPKFFSKWGNHYLLSLTRAHQLQQCNNFKDPGIQHYGGTQFNSIRDVVDELFLKLPAPKPSASSSSGSYSSGPVNMASYHSCSNPCFAGKCKVKMADGSEKPASEVRRGDKVMSPDGASAEIEGVIKTVCEDGKVDLVELGELLVTPYHPVRVNGKWRFPIELGKVEKLACEAVYSFVMREKHIMSVGGIECVGLGHGFVGDSVVEHEFLGSSKVLESLKGKKGWESKGIVRFGPGCLLRDPQSKLVIGFGEELDEEEIPVGGMY